MNLIFFLNERHHALIHLDDSVTNHKATELRKGEWTHEKSSLLSLPPTQFIFYFTVFKCLVTHLNWEFHSLKTEWKKPFFLLIARFLRTLTQISKERQKKKKTKLSILEGI